MSALFQVLDHDQALFNRDDALGVSVIPIRVFEDRYRKRFSEIPKENFPEEGLPLQISLKKGLDLGKLVSTTMQLPDPPLRREAVMSQGPDTGSVSQTSVQDLPNVSAILKSSKILRQGSMARQTSVKVSRGPSSKALDGKKIKTAVLTERYDPNRDRAYPVVLEKYVPPQGARPNQRRRDISDKVYLIVRLQRNAHLYLVMLIVSLSQVKVEETLNAGQILEAHFEAMKGKHKEYLRNALQAAQSGEVQPAKSDYSFDDWMVYQVELDDPNGPTSCGGAGELLIKMKLEREFENQW